MKAYNLILSSLSLFLSISPRDPQLVYQRQALSGPACKISFVNGSVGFNFYMSGFFYRVRHLGVDD